MNISSYRAFIDVYEYFPPREWKYTGKMNGTSVHVKIFKTDKCIYENNNSVVLNANNLSSLISCLKNTRLEVNDFLTSLVEEQRCSADAGDRLTSESDTDFEDEVEVINPKKSKLTDQ